ncbi:MAG: O-antigen ligase family protein [Clostridiales bacterium]|nr:O-antigen ligase family protein [Clostridiales bacterium]
MNTGEYKLRKEKADKPHSRALGKSVIISALSRFAKKLYKTIQVSVIGTVLSAFDTLEEHFDKSKVALLINHGGAKRIARSKEFKNFFSSRIETSALLSLARKFSETLYETSLVSCGVFFLSFGIYVSVIYAIKEFAVTTLDGSVSAAAVGIAAIVISVFCFASKKSISQAITSSAIVKFAAFDVLGFRRDVIDDMAKNKPQNVVGSPFIAGMVLGVLSFWVDPITIIKAVAAIIIVVLIMNFAESGLVFIFFAVPFIPTKIMAALIILVTASFFVKYLCGRRVIKSSVLDVPVLAFLCLTLSGGVISVDPASSLPRALMYACFIFGYFLVRWMFRSEDFIRRTMCAVSVALAIVSVIGIIEYFIGSPSDIWQDKTLFADLKGRVVSTFENPNMLSEYLIMTIPMATALFISSDNKKADFGHLVSAALGVFCLVLTWSRGAWLGIAVAGIFTLLVISRDMLVAAIIALPAAVAGLTCINSPVISRFTSIVNVSDSSTSYRIGIWRSSVKMLRDCFLYGIGVGEGAFETVFPYYAMYGITSAHHSHSLYLQIAVETGVFSLIIFLLGMFVLIQKNLSFAKTASSKKNKLLSLGLFCGVLGFLIQGLTDYVWYNYKICLLFWLLVGLSAAFISDVKESSSENLRYY